MDAPHTTKDVLPLFKSHYSLGKSILTLSMPPEAGKEDPDGPTSVFTIAKRQGLKAILLVEDTFAGFPEAERNAKKCDIQLVFGLSFDLRACAIKPENTSKIYTIAANTDGIQELKKLYSLVHTRKDEYLLVEDLKAFPNLLIVFPFYDSFLAKNAMFFESHIVDAPALKPIFLIEDNDHPFDVMLRPIVESFCAANSIQTRHTKTIYYEKREDFDAFVAYRIDCNRSYKNQSLAKPELEYLGSDSFCAEALWAIS